MTRRTEPVGSDLVDSRGHRCPQPIIDVAQWARWNTGTVTLRADDPAAQHDVAAWCRMKGHELVASEQREEAGGLRYWEFVIDVRPPSPAPGPSSRAAGGPDSPPEGSP